MGESKNLAYILDTIDNWSKKYRDMPFNVTGVKCADKVDSELSAASIGAEGPDMKIFTVEISDRYKGKNIGDMFSGEDGLIIEALLKSDYLSRNINGSPMRKFLNVKPIGSKPESVKILLAEEEFFKWNAVQALADKLNVMREEGRNVFDTLYGVTIMGEVRKDPTVTAVDDKVMKILKANCFNREHSPFNFRHVDPKWITIRGAYSEKDYERMAFIETLSGHPLTLMEPPYTSDFFKKLNSAGEEQYIAEVLDAHVGYASVIFDAKKNPEPLTMGGVDRNYDKTAFLDYFSVLRSSQKKGVGKKIINKIESDAKEYGKEVLSLNTPTINTDAVSFYSALGFRVAAVIPDKYASGIDAVLMSKDIAG